MESPVSAFSIYKTTLKNSPKKEKRKRNKRQRSKVNSPKVLSSLQQENIIKEIAQDVREKQKFSKKGAKGIQKTKINKKKNKVKNQNSVEKQNGSTNHVPAKPIKKRRVPSENEDVPQLVARAPPLTDEQHLVDLEEVCSHSSLSSQSFDFTPVETESVEEGLKVFKWMIAPFNPDEFLNSIWEKLPLHIARKKPKYYKEILSTPIIDNMLRTENIQFTKNIDVTSYVDEKRETHNPEGRAHPHLVWDFYLNGCSIRLLNPQTYVPKLHLLNATLQEFFNSFVGANAYLTPPDSQGFAPHYDDIEAFILQVEGKKQWKIYKPRTKNEVLPRVSSKNFDQNEIGTPMMEVTLEAGDMLYFPRGFIHQGVTVDGEHSLHVTISMYQKHSWADLFEKLIPAALQMTINENVELREGLPFDLYENFGVVNSDVNTPRRKQIEKVVFSLFDKIKNHLPIDDAVDQMSKNYQHDALPPVLTDLEKAVTVHSDTDVMIANGKVTNRVEIGLDTKIRLLRRNILRMVSEDKIRLYYHAENSLEYHGSELCFLEIEEDFAPSIETLITSYPEYVAVENLDIANDSDKLQIADALWSRGLIMTEYPMETIDDE